MSKIQECADLIIGIMTYSSKDEQIRNESKLNSVIESMLIFLDVDDLRDILNERVVPHLLPTIHLRWYDYIKLKLKDWEECSE